MRPIGSVAILMGHKFLSGRTAKGYWQLEQLTFATERGERELFAALPNDGTESLTRQRGGLRPERRSSGSEFCTIITPF